MNAVTRVARRAVPGPLFYGWHIALAGAASNFLILGTVTFGFGVFIQPMREEMGWSLAAISLGFSLRSFEQGLLAPVGGFLVDWLGPRRMALIALVVTVSGLLMFSQAHDIRVYYLASLTIALGQSVGGHTSFSAALMNWFNQKRGRAMGLLNAGNGGGYLMAPVLAVLIGAFGWRETVVIAAVTILYLGIPLALLLHDRPEPYGYLPDGERRGGAGTVAAPAAPQVAPASMNGMSVADALRTPAFYLLAISTAAFGATLSGWIVHQIPHLQNVGFSLQAAALIGGIYGLVQIALRVVVGWVGDIVGRRRMYVAAFLVHGVGMLIFANLTASRVWLLPFYYLTFALGHATWVVFQQTMVADYFGTMRFATLRGLSSTLQMPFGVVSPFLAGWMFDQTGSYQLIFTVYAAITATGALWVLLIRRPMWAEVEAAAQ